MKVRLTERKKLDGQKAIFLKRLLNPLAVLFSFLLQWNIFGESGLEWNKLFELRSGAR